MAIPQPGETHYLFSTNARLDWQGIVIDPDVPLNMAATMELVGTAGVITVPVLVGPQGQPGRDRPIIKLIPDPSVDDPSKLPKLTNTPDDIQKGYFIGHLCYWWDGRQWHGVEVGIPGPAGPVPVMHISVMLLDPDGDEETGVVVTGTPAEPGVLFKLKVPKGPKGDSTDIRLAHDYDDITPPAVGDVITWLPGGKYGPSAPNKEDVGYYTFPQSLFKAQPIAVGANVPIGTFTVPKQPFDWKPWVNGSLKLAGAELDLTPFGLRVEVRRDSKDGPLCAVGFGTSSTMTLVNRHFSSPGNKTVVVSANNDTLRCDAGKDVVFYVIIANDGFGGVYSYDPDWTEFEVECKRMN